MSLVKVLPKNLTVPDWSSKKKIPTKISGSTGIGAALTRLKAEWEKVDWEALDPNTAVVKHDPTGVITHAVLDLAAPAAAANKTRVPAVRAQLTKVLTLIKATETKWRANKLIPSASLKHVTAMKTAAAQIADSLDGLNDDMDKEWSAAREMAAFQARQKSQSTLTKLRGHAANIRAAASRVLQAEDTVKAYQAFKFPSKAKNSTEKASPSFHQLVNVLNDVLKGTSEPQWAAARQNFAVMAANGFLPSTESQVTRKVNQVLQAVTALETTL